MTTLMQASRVRGPQVLSQRWFASSSSYHFDLHAGKDKFLGVLGAPLFTYVWGRMKWVWADISLHRTSVFKDSRDFLVAYRWYSRLYYTIGHQHGGPRCERLSLSRHCLFFAFGKRPSWPARKLGISFWVNVADCCKWALGHGDCRAGERRVSFEL